MKIKLEGFSFQSYINEIIIREFFKLRREFDARFSGIPCDVELEFYTEEVLLWNAIKNIRESSLSREMIRGILIDFEKVRYGHYCNACFEIKPVKSEKGSVMKLEKMYIEIHADRLNDLIINHLGNLDLVIENMKLSIRQEFIHILECIPYHGMPEDEFIAMENKRNKELLNGCFILIDGKKRTIVDIRPRCVLGSEGIANTLTDDDIEAKFKNQETLNKIDYTKLKTTITITSSKRRGYYNGRYE